MKVKRIVAVLMAVMMLVSSMGMTAFADDTSSISNLEDVNWKEADAVVLVQVANPYCTELVKIADNLQAVVKYTKDGETRDVATVDVEKVQVTGEEEGEIELALWLGVGIDAVEDDIMNQLKELQASIDFDKLNNPDLETEEGWDEYLELYEEYYAIISGYSVELIGLDEELCAHYGIDPANEELLTTSEGMVYTAEVINSTLKAIGELFEVEVTEETTVTEMINSVLSSLYEQEDITLETFLKDMEFTEEEIAEVMAVITELEDFVSYIRSDEYPGMVFASLTLDCACEYPGFDYEAEPVYEIYHAYYEKDANGDYVLVDFVNGGTYEDSWGDMVCLGEWGMTVDGFENRVTKYNGKKYDYVGSYDSTIEWYYEDIFEKGEKTLPDEEWAEFELENYVLEEDSEYYGLVLRYELNEDADTDTDEPASTDKDDSAKDDQKDKDSEKTVTVTNADTDTEDEKVSDVPLTGDKLNMAVYGVMAIVSLGAALTLIMARKRQEEK